MFNYRKLVLPVITTLVLSTNLSAEQRISERDFGLKKIQIQANPLAPGIIVKYKSINKSQSFGQSKQRALDLGDEFGIDLTFKRMMSGNAEVLSFGQSNNKSLNAINLNEIVNKLNKRPDVEYAEVDAWMVPYATPNDTSYGTQWHYFESAGGMRLPAAWDTTTGSSSVTVAVLDTGYRPHADLAGNVIGQYDMITSTFVSVDGDGRDNNAQDPGDFVAAAECGGTPPNPAQDSSWHGTHVAGTIAAVSNNNSSVAGVAWNIGLVPVRVLGKCGGSLSDITDGIRWAAGLSVPGVPNNPNPADVINMSLGSSQPAACGSSYQNAINAAFGAGTTIVVASGNDNDTANYSPGNCSNVVTVAATNRTGGRAYYSNYGSNIDVSAPGGEGCVPITSGLSPQSLSDCQGGVWVSANMIQSTHNAGTSTPGADSIGALQGTSMATPHVAGLAALMYSVKPTATPTEIESALKSTARSFPNVAINQCTTANCGAGIVDANAAVLAMSGAPSNNVLTNGAVETGLSGATNNTKAYTLEVPAGASNLGFALTNISGDADLYVKFGSAPTTSSYDCRSWNGAGQNETCNIASAQTGIYHVLIHAYAAYSGASLTGSFSASVPNVAPNAAFTSSCTDLSCTFNGSSSSDSDGSISNYSWSFGGTGANASHTYGSAGTYSVTLTVTDDDGATDTATHSVTVTEPPAASNELINGVAQTGLSASQGNTLAFTMVVPAGASDLSFALTNISGDADLYVKFGSAPATSSYDCRSWNGAGQNELCDIATAQAGTYHVMINAYTAFSGASLVGSYTAGGSGQSVFSSTSNVNIPDNNAGGATSNISVNRTGNSGNVKITYNIVHTYRGDLKVEIVAPNGATAILREPSGGGTANINESKTLDAGTTPASGAWGLRVIDNANQDTGYINSWSIEFL